MGNVGPPAFAVAHILRVREYRFYFNVLSDYELYNWQN